MNEESKLDQDHQIRVNALRLALQHKKENGTRYTIHTVAAAFERYIHSGAEFRDV
ncbi:hypothetical protein [Rhizobium rhizogenes]|uniref:hypothetical protein n=1 Tax=Rhizobium rhizogenes TaxID=359 RepID=UPI000B1A5E06|nr:hypothetical protein [Rhizobium rhizogenes]NTJ22270.1 hypothetical protein [Rhizobium rhizogenes]QUE80988.1 hypothetical protein EML492_04030 [Rhizobium rhizogenes]